MNVTYTLKGTGNDLEVDNGEELSDSFIETSVVTKAPQANPNTTKRVTAKKAQPKKATNVSKKSNLPDNIKKMIGKVPELPKDLNGKKVTYHNLNTQPKREFLRGVPMTTIKKHESVTIDNWLRTTTTFGQKYVLFTADHKSKFWSNAATTLFLDSNNYTPDTYNLIISRLEDGQFTIGVAEKPDRVIEVVGNYKDICEEDKVESPKKKEEDNDVIIVEAPQIEKI